MRVLYALGPGDVVRSYRVWKSGADVATETSVSFSGQFFDYCRDNGAEGHAVSSNGRREVFVDGQMILENRSKVLWAPHGLRYHLSGLLYVLSLAGTAIRRRVDVVVVDTYTAHWFLLAIFRVLGIPVVASLHGTLWPRGFPLRKAVDRVIQGLDRALFWRRGVSAVVCVSPECAKQVLEMQGDRPKPIFQYRAQYRKAVFEAMPPPSRLTGEPLRVLFAGRVEREKGVFDLVEAAARIEATRPGTVAWRVCGDGGALQELRAEVSRRGLDGVVKLLGQLDREALREQYAWCHLVVVPTRSDCREGLPMAAAEAILAGRPVVLSSVCPAVDVLGEAAVEARADDPGSYAELVLRIAGHPDEHARRREACGPAMAQFLDAGNGLAWALRQAIAVATGDTGGRRGSATP